MTALGERISLRGASDYNNDEQGEYSSVAKGMPMMIPWRCLPVALAVALVLLLQGCREEEQGQILVHEKGVYQGPEDQPLAEPTLGELRERARIQSF